MVGGRARPPHRSRRRPLGRCPGLEQQLDDRLEICPPRKGGAERRMDRGERTAAAAAGRPAAARRLPADGKRRGGMPTALRMDRPGNAPHGQPLGAAPPARRAAAGIPAGHALLRQQKRCAHQCRHHSGLQRRTGRTGRLRRPPLPHALCHARKRRRQICRSRTHHPKPRAGRRAAGPVVVTGSGSR